MALTKGFSRTPDSWRQCPTSNSLYALAKGDGDVTTPVRWAAYIPRIRTDVEYAKLPGGEMFVGPDGVRRTKTGKV
jgi:hypothetical protein